MKTPLEIAKEVLESVYETDYLDVEVKKSSLKVLADAVIRLSEELEHASNTGLHLYDKGKEQSQALKEAAQLISEVKEELGYLPHVYEEWLAKYGSKK